jgi:hypothetical protein
MGRGFATNVKIREIIIKKYCQGQTVRIMANDLDVPKSTVGDIKYQFIEGTVNAEKYQEILQNSLLPTLQFCILKMILFSNKMGQHVTPRKQLKNGSVNIT